MDNGVKIGILGGTFDPIHLGHVHLASQATRTLGLQKVLFVPARNPWMKNDKKLSAPSHRLNMTYLALENNINFQADDLEITRSGISYTIDTIIELKHRFDPGTVFYLIMGEDAARQINYWKDPNQIIKMVKLAVMTRARGQSLMAEIDKNIKFKWIDNSAMFLEVSSTKIRKMVNARKSIGKIVHRDVEKYIHEHKLYRDLGEKND